MGATHGQGRHLRALIFPQVQGGNCTSKVAAMASVKCGKGASMWQGYGEHEAEIG